MDSEPTIPSRASPEIKLTLRDIETVMTWENTILRYFDEGDGMYDHVAHRLEDRSYIAFVPNDSLMEQLLNQQFPRYHCPVVDEATMKWSMQQLARELFIDQTDPLSE